MIWLWLRLIVIIRLASVWTLAVMLSRILMIDLLLMWSILMIALSSISSRDMLHLHLQAMHGSSELVA
jgi:hypothetical protein